MIDKIHLQKAMMIYRLSGGLVRCIDLDNLGLIANYETWKQKTKELPWCSAFRDGHRFSEEICHKARVAGAWTVVRVDLDEMLAAVAAKHDCHPADLLLLLEET